MSDASGIPVEQRQSADLPAAGVDCAYVRDLSAAYALAAVELHERDAIVEHLKSCPVCSRLVDQLTQTTAMLAFSVRQVSPPVTSKATLLARIAHSSQQLPGTVVMSAEELEAQRTATLPASTDAFNVPTEPAVVPPPAPERSRRFTAWAMPLAMVPLLLALGMVSYWGIENRSSLADRSDQVDAMSAEVSLLTQQVASYSASMASMDKYFRNDTAEEFKLVPTGAAATNGAGGNLIAPPQGEAMLAVWGLGSQSDQYEVLLQRWDGQTETSGTFQVNDDGNATTFLDLEDPISSYSALFVRPVLSDTMTDSANITQPEVLRSELGSGFGQQGDTTPDSP